MRRDRRVRMDGQRHARRAAPWRRHPSARARSGPMVMRVVLLAPVEMMVGEQVGAHAELRHAAELRRIRHLAVLQRVAVVPARGAVPAPPRPPRWRLRVASSPLVWMCTAGRRREGEQASSIRRGRCSRCRWAWPSIVARPAQPAEKPWIEPSRHDLHQAEAQPVVVPLTQPGDPARCPLGGGIRPCGVQRRQQAQREVVVAASPRHRRRPSVRAAR